MLIRALSLVYKKLVFFYKTNTLFSCSKNQEGYALVVQSIVEFETSDVTKSENIRKHFHARSSSDTLIYNIAIINCDVVYSYNIAKQCNTTK